MGGYGFGACLGSLLARSCWIADFSRFLSKDGFQLLVLPLKANLVATSHQGIADGSHVTALCASLDGVQPRPRPFIPRPSPATQAAPFQSAVFRPQNILMSHHVA